jgi:hypothetical protein
MGKASTKTPCVVCGKLPDLPLLAYLGYGPPWLSRTGECRRCVSRRGGKKGGTRTQALHPEMAAIGERELRRWETENPEEAKAVRASLRGQRRSAVTRAKISAGSRGRKLSEEARRKIGAAVSAKQLGRILSPEHRARISAALRGVPKGPPSEETRRKISAATRGQKRSEETRAKIIAALRRRPKDPT